MRKANFAFLAATILIALVAAPVYAQSIRLTANIPFDFIVGSTTMPAGEYTIDNMLGRKVAHVYNQESGENVAALFHPATLPRGVGEGQASLIFHRYDNTYFLSKVRDGSTEGLLPITNKERELEKNAALYMPDEKLVVLAQR